MTQVFVVRPAIATLDKITGRINPSTVNIRKAGIKVSKCICQPPVN